MAERALLHRSKFNDFRSWLQTNGWVIEEIKDRGTPFNGFNYKILQARCKDRREPLMVYDRHDGDHLSLLDRDTQFVRQFINDSRKED